MTLNPYSTALNVLKSWDFQINTGYNKLYLPQATTVQQGSIIKLIQSTGLVALDQSGSASFSDLTLTSNQWANLYSQTNWRFYLNTTNDFELKYYKTSFNLNRQYTMPGLYNLTISYQNIFFEQTINVSICNNYLKFFYLSMSI